MEQHPTRVYGYRWAILAGAAPIILASQICWLTFAPVAAAAQAAYRTSELGISMLSMSYMIAYIVFTFPASWIVDSFGFRRSLIIGAAITAIGALARAACASSFTGVMICQFVIAAGQPFLLNVLTKIPANWFPLGERSTASGVLTLVQYVGMIVPMAASPLLVNRGGMHAMLTCYAVIAAITALLAILLTREHPPLPPGPVPEREQVSLRSMIGLLGNGAFVQILVLMFISLGVFNTLLTEVDGILTPRGLSTGQADAAGAVFVVAGIAGAVILPAISDRMRRRMPLLSVGMVLMTVFYLLLTFAHGAVLITVITGLAGLTIMGLAPIVFQHSAETAYPVGEGSSFGLLFLMGQVSGALFIFLYEWVVRHTGSVLAPMLIFVVLTAIQVPIAFHMKESRVLLAAQGAAHA